MNDLMQQRVLSNLIVLYQGRGLSMERMLKNPIFIHLPIEQKIAIVKKYGQQATANNGTHWDKDDTKKLLLGLGLGALAITAAIPTYGNLMINLKNKTPVGEIVEHIGPELLGLIGASGGATSQFSSLKKNYEQKKLFGNLNINDDNAIINYLART